MHRLFGEMLMRARFLAVVCLILSMFPAAAMAQQPAVKVAVRVLPPFVEQQPDGRFTGFTIDLWDTIAERQHWHTQYVAVADVRAQLDAVSSGKADAGAGAISITAERDLRYDFSQPMLNAGLQILVRSEHAAPETTALTSLMHLLFSPAVLVWLGIAALLTIVPAHIVWFLERRHPDGMIASKSYFPGIFQAFFWGLGTLATQADSMPRHWASRIVAVLWMFTSVVFVAFYTATLTASLTVQQFRSEINGPDDLPGKAVATVAGTTSADYLGSTGARVRTFARIDDAVKALNDKKVDAVVYDAPVLQYIAAHDPDSKTTVTGPVFRSEDYGFAFRNGSPLRKPVDATLLSLREDGTYDRLSQKWFGKR
jgi:polar amino acid transport system substrate-binding protein